jgi:hypothetical protein
MKETEMLFQQIGRKNLLSRSVKMEKQSSNGTAVAAHGLFLRLYRRKVCTIGEGKRGNGNVGESLRPD